MTAFWRMAALGITCAPIIFGCAAFPPAEKPFTRTPDAAFRDEPPAPSEGPVLRLPSITHEILPNGMVVVLSERRDLPMVSLAYANRAARDDGTVNGSGLAGLTMGMLNAANSPHAGERGFAEAKRFWKRGAYASGTILLSSFAAAEIEQRVTVLASMLQEPRFDTKRFGATRTRLVERAKRALATGFGKQLALEQLHGRGHPLTLPFIGNPAAIEGFTLEGVETFHSKHYGPDNGALVIVGAFDVESTLALVRREFGAWANTTSIPKDLTPRSEPWRRGQIRAYDRGLRDAYVLVVVPCVGLSSPDGLAADVFAALFEDVVSSTAYKLVRHHAGGSYDITSRCLQRPQSGALWIEGDVSLSDAGQLVWTILRDLGQRTREEPEAEALETAKMRFLGRRADRLSTNEGLAFELGQNFTAGFELDYLDNLESRTRALTPADILAVANRTAGAAAPGVVVFGPRKFLQRQLDPLGAVAWMKSK
ncbi:MAG TPA: pitrilysin family protein [Polyangiaceae bacterium]